MELDDFRKMILEYSREINENMSTAFRCIGENYGLTLMQHRILMELCQKESYTIGGLAEAVRIAGANISTMCKRLEKLGYVQRYRDDTDERIVRIELTQLGKKTIMEINHYLNNKLTRILGNDAEETFQVITAGMERINSVLQKMSMED